MCEPHALLVLADAIAEEIRISLLALDQLLWWQGEPATASRRKSGTVQPP